MNMVPKWIPWGAMLSCRELHMTQSRDRVAPSQNKALVFLKAHKGTPALCCPVQQRTAAKPFALSSQAAAAQQNMDLSKLAPVPTTTLGDQDSLAWHTDTPVEATGSPEGPVPCLPAHTVILSSLGYLRPP